MFSLLRGLWGYLFSKTDINVLILGLDYAGKTTILEQVKAMFKKVPVIPADKIPPTVGLNVGKMDIKDCCVTFWDLGGQVRVRSLWERYYKDAHGIVFVIDSADVGRFEEARLAFDIVREQGSIHGIPIMLCANKQDLPGAITTEDIYQSFDLHKVSPTSRGRISISSSPSVRVGGGGRSPIPSTVGRSPSRGRSPVAARGAARGSLLLAGGAAGEAAAGVASSVSGSGFRLQAVSALTSEGLRDGMCWIVEEAKRKSRAFGGD